MLAIETQRHFVESWVSGDPQKNHYVVRNYLLLFICSHLQSGYLRRPWAKITSFDWNEEMFVWLKFKKTIYFFTNIINKYFCWKLWLKWKCLVKCEKNKYIDNDIKLTLEGLPYSLRWMQPWYCLPIGENHQSRYVRVVICSLTCKLIISLQRKRSPGFPCPFSK